MRQVLFVAAILLSTAVPSFAQEQLKIGNTYSGNIKLSSPNNGIYLALPEGTWTLVSTEERHGTNFASPLLDGIMISTDKKKRVLGVVSFTAGNDSIGGWQKASYCSRKDLFFLHAEVIRHGRGMDCWGVRAIGTATPSAKAASYVHEFYQWAAKNGIKAPQTMIVVDIYRSSGAKYLHAMYFRNPEIAGFPRAGTAVWQKDVVVGDQKRLKYLEGAKAWGEQWQPTFEAAFAGRPK
jgi:hypothetical protein